MRVILNKVSHFGGGIGLEPESLIRANPSMKSEDYSMGKNQLLTM